MNNLFEEWNSLIWNKLPSTILSKALPPGFVICQADIYLNRTSPLRQTYNGKKVTEGNFETAIELHLSAKDLLVSHDAEIRAYFEQRGKYYDLPLWRKLEGLRLGHAIQVQTHFRDFTLMTQSRQNFDTSQLMRNADPKQGDLTTVWIKCSRCNHPNTRRIDPVPLYERATGLYIRRKLACRMCPILTGKHGRWEGSRENCPTEPIDPAVKSTTRYTVYNNWKRKNSHS
jgi:hypothetical protein